ncbi:MAG: hypothetical protein KGH85_05800 [Thaumarchaeota archaeon]|nr:hypothetical protein [Nitrososphaerota archaeon]
MSQMFGKNTDKRILILSFAAAAATVIAGILHLRMAPGSLLHDFGEGVLFLVGGVLQIFWAVPVIKRWGRIWQIIGIVGTAVFFILWFTDRLHLMPEGNEIHGGGPPGSGGQGSFHEGNFTRGGIPPGGMPGGTGHRPMGIGQAILAQPIEMCQLAFIGLYIALATMISRSKKADSEQPEPEATNNQ